MTRNRSPLQLFLVTLVLLAARSAKAASLQPVGNWGASGVPSDVSMYIYVPDRVATNPPILVLVHYCGGTAPAVFGQAQGGGIVRAADQFGFIMVVPSSGRCWDVVSDKTRTRDGGGDTQAIIQMVKYAINTYRANADRVYATGDSSGGMMTELLLAIYPDVFKAGASFAGMPAGCRAAGESGSGGGYSGACGSGSVTHTAQEWGDIVRMMNAGYVGHRPRVQLFHGDADMTINYRNHTEAIKQWTNVLGLSTNPMSTDAGVPLGMHQATRQRWQNACGYVVFDAFTSIGGDHGPSDALFSSQYVIPFLGLDKTGPVDPEIDQCGQGGSSGADGGRSEGGVGGSGGARDSGLVDSGSRGTGTGGNGGSGGAPGAGGGQGNGGAATGGNASGNGGASSGTAGDTTTGASGGNGSSGTPSRGDAAGSSTTGVGSSNAGDEAGSSGCALGRATSNKHGELAGVALGVALMVAARSRRRPTRFSVRRP